jgi:signal peptidase I
MIPLCGYALEKLQINVNTKVTIDEKYEVTYSYRDYLTEEEAKTYKSALTRKEYYGVINEYYIVDGKKYTEYYVTKSDGFYKPGDEVTVKDQDVYERIECENEDDWTGNEFNGGTCNSGIFGSKINIPSEEHYNWAYMIQNNNDLSIMNFRGQGELSYENYNDENNVRNKFIKFKNPKTFTMPRHDVNIIEFIDQK